MKDFGVSVKITKGEFWTLTLASPKESKPVVTFALETF